MSEDQTKPAAREISRKITISTVTGGPKKWFDKLIKATPGADGVQSLDLCRIYGYAQGYTAGVSDFGEFIKFAGSFRGVNLDTGEVSEAPQVILQPFLAAAFKSALDAPERSGPVQFAFLIRAVYDPSAAAKYRYAVLDLLPPAVSDPLAELEARMLGAPAATPALPPAAPAPAPAPAASAPAPKGKGK